MTKLLGSVMTSLTEQDTLITATTYSCDRIARMQKNMHSDVQRHETLCFELAKRVESHRNQLLDHVDNIENLKTYAITTDLHLEAYLPLQIANISFEVGKGLLRDRSDRYAKHFVKKIIRPLESNCLKVCDPNID